MSSHRDDNAYWVRVQPGVVAKIENDAVAGLMIYGDITSERLREVNVTRVNLAAGNYKHGVWYLAEPPSSEWAWEPPLSSGRVTKGRIETRNYGPDEIRDYIVDSATRRESESASDYYGKFALVYQQVAFMVNNPVEVIAEALGTNTNTIYQYIHRARTRGFLPPTKRSAR